MKPALRNRSMARRDRKVQRMAPKQPAMATAIMPTALKKTALLAALYAPKTSTGAKKSAFSPATTNFTPYA
jgi:hypothetical protein